MRDPEQLVFVVALEDIAAAADLLRPGWEQTGGVDGYVSPGVPPGLAYDTQGSIDTARRLHRQVDRPNVLVKISGTPSGRAAMPDADFDNWPTIADTAPVICSSPHRARRGSVAPCCRSDRRT